MYPHSEAAATAMRAGSQTFDVSATLTSPGGTQVPVTITGGTVTIDAGRSRRRQCDVTCVDPTGALVPTSSDAALGVYGSEVAIYRGPVLPDGTSELIPLGVFVVTGVDLSETDTGVTIQISGDDRSVRISRNRWTAPYRIAPGALLIDALADAITDRWPACPISMPAIGTTISGAVTFEPGDSDPWKDLCDLAATFGQDLAFDATGTAVLRDIPDPSQEVSVATYSDGTDAALTSITRGLSLDGHYNGVVVLAEGPESTTAVVGQAWDDDPTSPTYRFGPLGAIPRFMTVSAITSAAEAEAAATAQLLLELGASENVNWTKLVNPALDVFDVVTIERTRLGVSAPYVIDQLTIPLAADATMSAQARTRTVFTA